MPSPQPSMSRIYDFSAGRDGATALVVHSLRGVEGVSEPYHFDVVVSTERTELATLEGELLGEPARLSFLEDGVRVRSVHGVISRVRPEGAASAPERARFELRLVPRLWLLKKSRTSRVFQDLSIREIISGILARYDIECEWCLSGPHPKRDYCVQYQESDFRFVQRLLAEEGVLYFFDHPLEPDDDDIDADAPRAREVIVFADAPARYRPMDGAAWVDLRAFDSSHGAQDSSIRSFRPSREVATGAAVLREYDFRRPGAGVTLGAKIAPPRSGYDESILAVYDHHSDFEGSKVARQDAGVYLEQERARAASATGEGFCKRFAPGRTFGLNLAVPPTGDAEYVVVRLEHFGRDEDLAAGDAPAGAGDDGPLRHGGYFNRFVCVAKGVAFRPKRPKRQVQQGLETGTIVGPPGQEVFTDEFGRVRVQFHWDREGKRDERSSCWIRTMHAWSGAGWGTQFVPRVGMEVVVGFAGGDIDRPVVLGSVYNGPNPAPYHATRSGVRSRSTPGSEGYNELFFEDDAGAEVLGLRAERNLDEVVQNDRRSEVGSNSVVEVARDLSETVGGSRSESVGALKSVTVGADLFETVGGSRSETVIGDRAAVVGGTRTERVRGNALTEVECDARMDVAGTLSTGVAGDLQTAVSGTSEAAVGRDAITRLAGHAVTVVGTPAARRSWLLHVEGTSGSHASGELELSSDKAVRLRCGESSILLTPESIQLFAKKVILQGAAVEAFADDYDVVATGAARVHGEKVFLRSSGGFLGLTGDALLDGDAVKLKSRVDAGADPDAPEVVPPTTFSLADQDGVPLAGERFIATFADGSQRAGVLDADGRARFEGQTDDFAVVFPDAPRTDSNGS